MSQNSGSSSKGSTTTVSSDTKDSPTDSPTYRPTIIPARVSDPITNISFQPRGDGFMRTSGIFEPSTNNVDNRVTEYNTKFAEFPTILQLLEKNKSIRQEKSQTFWDVYQNHENQFANIVLRCAKIENLLASVVKTELESILDIRYALIENLSVPVSVPVSVPPAGQFGGHENERTNANIVMELNRKEGDSQHDFKPSATRNNVFPVQIVKASKLVNVVNGSIVLDKISEIVFNSSGAPSRELNSYFDKDPIHFEEDIKVDYLLGDLAGNLDDVSYYFTEGTIPTTWIEARRKFFETAQINGIQKLFMDVEEFGIEYWLFDACMSSSIKNNMTPERFITLANLWDPAKSKNPTLEELTEYKMSKDPANQDPANPAFSQFVPDVNIDVNITNKNIFDWQNARGESYYDKIYGPLINQDIMTNTFGIEIKLRIAVEKNVCSVAICVFVADEFKKMVIVRSGFGVNELAMGMHYIETGATSNTKGKGQTIRSELKELIDTLYQYFTDVSRITDRTKRTEASKTFLKNEYYKLLLRFKSSGDHGSANTVQLLNNLLKKRSVFLSGDNLAYVYSIASGTPTVCNYYKASSGSKEEDDDDDDDDDAGIHSSGPQFIAGYFPLVDSPEKYEKQFNKKVSVIGSLQDPAYENPNYTQPDKTKTLTKLQYRELYGAIASFITDTDTFIQSLEIYKKDIDNATVTTKITGKIAEIFNTKIAGIDLVNVLEMVPNSIDALFLNESTYDFEAMKKYNILVTSVIRNIYFIKNYVKIVKLIQENMKEAIARIGEIVRIDEGDILATGVQNQSVRSSSRRAGVELTTNVAGLVNQFKNSAGKIDEKIKIDRSRLLEAASSAAPLKGEKKSLREDLVMVYSRLISIKKELSTSVIRELNMDSTFYGELSGKIEDLKREYYVNLTKKINEVPHFGSALNDYFAKCFKIEDANRSASSVIEAIPFVEEAKEANEVLNELQIPEIPPVTVFKAPPQTVRREKKPFEQTAQKIAMESVIENLQIRAKVTVNRKQGAISRVRDDGTYDVRYADGTKETNVTKEQLTTSTRRRGGKRTLKKRRNLSSKKTKTNMSKLYKWTRAISRRKTYKR
jgi:hypothetical protein